jgi:murein DD-endopeptidase MepM/ murein hydrolase activator NlpD
MTDSDPSHLQTTEGMGRSGSPADPTAVFQTPQPDDVAVMTQTPLPEGGGIRPGEAQLLREPELGLESPVDWRPPPVPVPHSLHPDDHYWLARPIASDSRNYDLTWYHYANRPMRVEALPYRVHHGLDFPNETGTPIFAAGSGTVVWAGNFPSNRDGVNYYGNTVIIKHDWLWLGQNVYTLYAHTLELFVEVDDFVEKGQLIAGVGASGEVSGPHLHLEVRVGENNYQSTRNPALWLAPYEGWGTLAGRFMDQRGRLIHGAQITVFPVDIDNDIEVSIKRLRTYEPSSINSDDVWLENFVVGDLPAGEYRVVISTAGETFRRTVFVRPGMTNYFIMQADFIWGPTDTPTPTITLTPTLSPTGTPTPAE